MRRVVWGGVFVTAAIALVLPGCLAEKRTLVLEGAPGATDAGGIKDAPSVPNPPGACNPITQTGCASNQKCALDSMNEVECAPPGIRAVRTSCNLEPDNCVAGHVCTPVPRASTNVCRQLCARKEDCKQPPPQGQPTNEAFCAYTLANSSYRVCATPCNPVPTLGVSGCPAGSACIYGDAGGVLITDCGRVRGSGANGSPCNNSDDDCADGYFCNTSVCRAYCRNGLSSDCAGGYVCVQIQAGAAFGACCQSTSSC